MTDIKIVSGLNYGDESKGLVANFISTSNSLTIMPSNSCQRAHTVVHNGIRKVFRHFGSGTLKGAATYFTEKFYVNPALFRQEWNELIELGIKPKVYCRKGSPIITAIDMFANVYIEEQRGENSHSSTGCGVWESINRNNYLHKVHGDLYTFKDIKDYYKNRLSDKNGITPTEVINFLEGKYLEDNIINDIDFFADNITIIETLEQEKELLHSYPLLVFENGQGLLLSDEWSTDYIHNTPAWVGGKIPSEIILRNFENNEINVESLYVSRTYYTRHGKGSIGISTDLSCNKNIINSKMLDKTNVPNPNQGTLRYGKFNSADAKLAVNRALTDCKKYFTDKDINATAGIVITHMNEFNDEFLTSAASEEKDKMNIYYSYSETDINKVSYNF